MTIAKIELMYSHEQKIKALSDEDYTRLRTAIMSLPEDRSVSFWISDCLIDLDTDGKILSDFGIEFTVKKIKGTIELKPLTGQGNDTAKTVHVHVPNVGLLSVNEVQVLEDCCTQELQSNLDEGWRILAVCPPNCQRRPDYIVGRSKP